MTPVLEKGDVGDAVWLDDLAATLTQGALFPPKGATPAARLEAISRTWCSALSETAR